MTESQAALMIKDAIRDCIEDAEPAGPDGDTSHGSMLIEGHCTGFADVDLPMPATAGFVFRQGRYRYTVHVLAERTCR